MVYKSDNYNTYTVSEACKDYDEWSKYEEPSSCMHALSHIMAAGLSNPNHFMDFTEAKKHLPMGSKQIAGYEAEVIARLYFMFLTGYDGDKSFDGFASKSMFLSNLEFQIKISNQNTIDGAVETFNSADKKGHTDHHKKHMKYVTEYKKNKSFAYPSDEEVSFHFDKAQEFCEAFKQKHKEYAAKGILY